MRVSGVISRAAIAVVAVGVLLGALATWVAGSGAGRTVVAAVDLVLPGTPGPGSPASAVVWALVAAGMLTATAWVIWERVTAPPEPAPLEAGDVTRAYFRDMHARVLVDRRGFLFSRRVLFAGSGTGWRRLRRLPAQWQERFEVPVAVLSENGRTWWAAGNEFYAVRSDYREETVTAILESMRWRRRPRLEAQAAPPGERRDVLLGMLRPNIGKHHGLVCIRCRGRIDPRERRVAPLWTDAGLRLADARIHCARCGTGEQEA